MDIVNHQHSEQSIKANVRPSVFMPAYSLTKKKITRLEGVIALPSQESGKRVAAS